LRPTTENWVKPAGLLVSVRSAEEARAAVEGGASVVDVKEPDRGPLGRASVQTWRAVRAVVPESIPVSVALGELSMWNDRDRCTEESLEGIAYRKLGLARAGLDWRANWARVRNVEPGLARWVAVAYADWQSAGAPHPLEVLEASLLATDCSGLLVDTWDKTKPSPLEVTTFWVNWVERVRQSGRFVALAGGLDRAAIDRLSPLQPDLFAVRGASCDHSDRRKTVSRERVAELVQAIRKNGSSVSFS
jgi:(5-formylfuran-3-yl)methyl phosphate synthase